MPSPTSKLYSVTKQGINAQLIELEVDVTQGLHAFSIVGLPDKAIEESKERVSSALKNNGFKPPRSFSNRVVVNLAPADIKKEGGVYDLPMALGFLVASKQMNVVGNALNDAIVIGELGLNGNIRPVKGVILYAMFAKEAGFKTIVVPYDNYAEAKLIRELDVVAVKSVKSVVDHLEGRITAPTPDIGIIPQKNTEEEITEADFAYIQGQETAKQALEIAIAGGHNVLFKGPPGTGKTLLAKAATTIMPSMTYRESLEVTKIESVCRQLSQNDPFITKRPFRAPHHSSSESAVIGGGSNLQPGEITRAHRGVLFLDEFPELRRNVLESLRQPLEEGSILVARAKGIVEYPAKFILIAAANPCPCGYFGDDSRECECTTGSIVKYRRKLSGPIADRIDLHVTVPRQKFKKLSSDKMSEPSSDIKKRVDAARKVQEHRFKDDNVLLNSEMKIKHIKKHCALDESLNKMLGQAIEKYKLSARGYHSLLKVSRTIADLNQDQDIKWEHIAIALQFAKRETLEI
ncbi:MAG: YifB family Mg chelatase-like AAA ATPase [Candidatus Spechtbacterales bacterium]